MKRKSTLVKFSGLSLAALVLASCCDKDDTKQGRKGSLTEEGVERLSLLDTVLVKEDSVAKAVVKPVTDATPVDVVPAKPAVSDEVLAKAVAGGKIAYVTCAACHQATGAGIPGAFPPIAKSNWVNQLENSEAIKIVLFGLQGEVKVNGVPYNGMMIPQGAMLNDQQVADVLTYVKNSWGNEGGYVAPDEVTEIREAMKGQGILKATDIKGADALK